MFPVWGQTSIRPGSRVTGAQRVTWWAREQGVCHNATRAIKTLTWHARVFTEGHKARDPVCCQWVGVERVDLGHVKPWVRRALSSGLWLRRQTSDKVMLELCLSLNMRTQTRWVQGSWARSYWGHSSSVGSDHTDLGAKCNHNCRGQ